MKLIVFTYLFAAVWTNENVQISETTLTEFNEDLRQAPSKNLFGPWEAVSVDDPMIKKYVEKAVEKQNKEFGDRYKRLTSVDQAKKQSISGYRFEINMTIRETECSKNDPNKDKCQFNSARAPEPVTFDVWVSTRNR